MQGRENSGIRKSGNCRRGNCRRKRTFGIGGRFQSASPPITGNTVDELSSRVVVIQVKTFESNSERDWAPNPGGNVVMVEVSGGGVENESGGGKDGTAEVGIEVAGLRQKLVIVSGRLSHGQWAKRWQRGAFQHRMLPHDSHNRLREKKPTAEDSQKGIFEKKHLMGAKERDPAGNWLTRAPKLQQQDYSC